MRFEMMSSPWSKLRAPRRDPSALAFGVAFVLLGVTGLLRVAGVAIDANTLSQLALILLGSAGIAALLLPGRRRA